MCVYVSTLHQAPFAYLKKNSIWQVFDDGEYLEEISEYDEFRSSQGRPIGETLADLPFPSLKKAHLDISSTIKKEEAIMLEFLLNNAPSLNTITVNLPYCPANIHDKEIRNKVLDLLQIYGKVDIRMKIDEHRWDVTCRGANDKHGHRSPEYSGSSESSDYLGSDHFGRDNDALNEFKLFYTDYYRYLGSNFHQQQGCAWLFRLG